MLLASAVEIPLSNRRGVTETRAARPWAMTKHAPTSSWRTLSGCTRKASCWRRLPCPVGPPGRDLDRPFDARPGAGSACQPFRIGALVTDEPGGRVEDPVGTGSPHRKVVQDRLCHASITTPLDTYGHLMTGLDEGQQPAWIA